MNKDGFFNGAVVLHDSPILFESLFSNMAILQKIESLAMFQDILHESGQA